MSPYLLPERVPSTPPSNSLGPAQPAAGALDNLIHQKARIFSRKLDILAAEIWWRFHVACQNLASLEDDRTRVGEMLKALDHAALYHLREHREKEGLYRRMFEIETEKRSQKVECWRDVVMVMRDFLYIWEAHEHARSRAIFLQHVGPRPQGYV